MMQRIQRIAQLILILFVTLVIVGLFLAVAPTLSPPARIAIFVGSPVLGLLIWLGARKLEVKQAHALEQRTIEAKERGLEKHPDDVLVDEFRKSFDPLRLLAFPIAFFWVLWDLVSAPVWVGGVIAFVTIAWFIYSAVKKLKDAAAERREQKSAVEHQSVSAHTDGNSIIR